VKILVHPLTGKQYRLGRKRPRVPHGRSSFHEMLEAKVLPDVAVPGSTNYSAAAMAALSNVYCNSSVGCCVISGGEHIRGVTSFNSGQGVIFTDAQTIRQYSAIGGYNPNDPSSDEGCDENTALAYWETNGFADGVLLDNAVTVDATNADEVRLACFLLENLYPCGELPDAWISPLPESSGFTWDVAGDPDPENGHCVAGVDLSQDGIVIDTWGMLGILTHAALAKYYVPENNGALFVLLSPDVISRLTQKSPAGYTIDALVEYLSQI
jgi:hypothetical protein